MRIGIPKETRPGETRVALVPDAVSRLAKSNLEFLVERGAGAGAWSDDSGYEKAGARLVDTAQVFEAEVLVKVAPPTLEEARRLRAGQVLIGFLAPLADLGLAKVLAGTGATCFSMELVPRITRAQSMDALSSMSSIAGYKAALLAAERLPRFFPMLVTAAGTLAPARVLILGAGVAGLQAIATARRIGAVVSAFDVRPAVKEQVQSLGAQFLQIEMPQQDTEDAGGYAKALSEEAHRREVELLSKAVREMDVVITTALVPGQRAPLLVTEDMVRSMKAGSVIVDLAAEAGGNCALTRPGEDVVVHGVTILGPLNLPATMAGHASQMYSRNISSFLQNMIKDGKLAVDMQDEILRGSCLTHEGRIVAERTLALVGAATA
ncbi:MAG TPA: Re/Si-specific NAD(P)(+) transhydrogenase subunit alpha [Candidatus Krumholzibacteria bacterium]|jgi:proton-translocating NAD(P)+ transhydrogenase subunit alpha|nr:Re/Si-specific NAD(P)(+) transhydrogenase subunit alpha [Candidatus Krumholzibacteria bacterium]